METMLALAIIGLGISIASFAWFLYLSLNFKNHFSGIIRLSDALEANLKDEDASELIYDSLDSFHHLGALAQNVTAVMTDEVALDGYLTVLAAKVRKSMIGAVMGTASGDVKKLAHAERVLNTAMIEGAKKMSPELALMLEVTGLGEELNQNPELFGYIIQIAEKNGLLKMFSGQAGSTPSVEQQAMVHNKLGIDF